MKVSTENEVILLSTVFVLLAVGGIFALKTIVPGTYNEITGRATGTTVNITEAKDVNCNFTLYKGMNLASFYCIGDFTDKGIVLNNLSDVIAIWEYRKGETDRWEVHNPNLPDYVINDLTHFGKRNGYWMKLNKTQQFFLDGFMATSTQIQLEKGYNLVGYPINHIEEINSSLQSIDGNYNKVIGYEPVNQTTIIYKPGSGGELNETRPGRGYWINMSAEDTWVVN